MTFNPKLPQEVIDTLWPAIRTKDATERYRIVFCNGMGTYRVWDNEDQRFLGLDALCDLANKLQAKTP